MLDEKKALRAVEDVQRVEKASPKVDDLKAAFGEQAYSEEGSEWRVKVTDEKLTPEENRRRWETFGEMMHGRRALQDELSHRDEAERETVEVWDEKNRQVREVPVELEGHIATKPWAKARVTGRRKRITSEGEIKRRMERERNAGSD